MHGRYIFIKPHCRQTIIIIFISNKIWQKNKRFKIENYYFRLEHFDWNIKFNYFASDKILTKQKSLFTNKLWNLTEKMGKLFSKLMQKKYIIINFFFCGNVLYCDSLYLSDKLEQRIFLSGDFNFLRQRTIKLAVCEQVKRNKLIGSFWG